ncbi:hypothetical protein QBC40DRAFT_36662 [Triangularia verruculosa]|uniref:Uncharacterized protein n=1 Tax=Triangularia verruculosa TaxID=2587418 RepID=A0AAN6XS09_9PEZI|nr:hypothetical protein QBC40DRAFT_36662 [Triangularia verruculosa]
MLYSPELTMNSHGSNSHGRGHSRRSSLASHSSSRRNSNPRSGLAGGVDNGPQAQSSSPKMPRMVRFMTAGHQVASGRVQKPSHHVERNASESPAARVASQMLRRTSGRPVSSHAEVPAMRAPHSPRAQPPRSPQVHSPRPSHLQSPRSSHGHSPRHARTPSSTSISGSLPPGQQAEMFQPQQRRKRRAVSPLRISPDPQQDDETQEDLVDTQPVTETPIPKIPRTPLADITPPTSASSQETIECSDGWDEPSQDENDRQVEHRPRQRSLSQAVDLLTEAEVRGLLVLYAKSDPSLSHFIHEVSLSRAERPPGRMITTR